MQCRNRKQSFHTALQCTLLIRKHPPNPHQQCIARYWQQLTELQAGVTPHCDCTRGRSASVKRIAELAQSRQDRVSMTGDRAAFAVSMSAGSSRRDVLRLFSSALGIAAVTPVRAATDGKPKKGERGSKTAKGYELCLSQCLYDCTTPKAAAAKARSECRVECKDECAVSREQL